MAAYAYCRLCVWLLISQECNTPGVQGHSSMVTYAHISLPLLSYMTNLNFGVGST